MSEKKPLTRYAVQLYFGEHRVIAGEGHAEDLVAALEDAIASFQTALERVRRGEAAGQVLVAAEPDTPTGGVN